MLSAPLHRSAVRASQIPLVLCLVLCTFTGNKLARADVARLLINSRESAQAHVDLIQQARQQVDAAYFGVDGGQAPLVVLTLLREAAERGVRVRLLIDGLQGRIPNPVAAYLIKSGVEIRVYHPLQWNKPSWWNRRLHTKLLVSDRDSFITGSRNLQDPHFELECVNYVDRDIYIRGKAADCAAQFFELLWNSCDVQPLRLNPRHELPVFRTEYNPDPFALSSASSEEIPALLESLLNNVVDRGWIRLESGNDWSANAASDLRVNFLGEDGPADEMSHEILRLFDSAAHTLIIETPYPAFSVSTCSAIYRARQRGVRVVLTTNSLASTDRTVAYAAYQNEKAELLRAGVELWEFRGPNHLHAKSIVVDDCWTFIGSHNFDARSEHKDVNVGVIIADSATAVQVRQSIEQHMAQSDQVDPQHHLSAERRHPGAERKDVRKLRWLRPVTPLIRRSL